MIMDLQAHLTRRELFGRSACGLGTAALASMLNADGAMTSNGGLTDFPHFPGKAKRVIYLFQNGARTCDDPHIAVL